MEELDLNNIDKISLKNIRKSFNKKFKFFGFSFSEYALLMNSFRATFLVFAFLMALKGLIGINLPVFSLTALSFIFLLFSIKRINKKFKEDMGFFVIKKEGFAKAIFTNGKKNKRIIEESKRIVNLQ